MHSERSEGEQIKSGKKSEGEQIKSGKKSEGERIKSGNIFPLLELLLPFCPMISPEGNTF